MKKRPKKALSSAARINEFFLTHPQDPVVLGVDPDLRNTAWALVVAGKVAGFGCIRVSCAAKGQQCALPTFLLLSHQLDHEPFWEGGEAPCGRLLYKPSIVLVEGQRVRQAAGAETKNPQSLVDLAAVTGAALAACVSRDEPPDGALVVEPFDWKGSVPKQAHQARVCRYLGWDYEKRGKDPSTGYVVPKDPTPAVYLRGVNAGDWKHIMDAVGLAYWGWCKATGKRPGR